MTTDTNSPARLWDLIRDIKFAMFTTRHENGHLHSRPMTTQLRSKDEEDRLWFFMSRSSGPVADLEADPTVNISYANPDEDRYVSVSGNARVVQDNAKIEALWTKQAQAWFPGGPEDPDLALVEVMIAHANYWDIHEDKAGQLMKMAAAEITGQPPNYRGETGDVRMQ
jgi:general stress protein 26